MSNKVNWETLSPSEKKSYWEGLFGNPAWVSLCQALQAQADALQQDIIFSPVKSVEDTYRLEGVKGELRGKLSASSTAEAMFAETLVEIAELTGNEGDQ